MNKEEIREFLKPDLKKMIFVLFLFLFSIIFSRQDNTFIPPPNPNIVYETDGRNELIGFPLKYIDMRYNIRVGFNLNNPIFIYSTNSFNL